MQPFALLSVCLLAGAVMVPLQAPAQTGGRLLSVGPNQPYPSLAMAARLARPGDTVRIVPGIYRECAVWTADNLTIQATPGTVKLQDMVCEGRAIFILRGDNITIDGIEFANARAGDRSGAGVRIDGLNATILRSTFRNNERGVFVMGRPGSAVTIERSSFYGIPGMTISTQVHAGLIDRLSVMNCTFRDTYGGAHIKSYALNTEVAGTTIEDGSGGAAYLIDIAYGGNVLVRDSRLQKNARATLKTAGISIGTEGARHPADSIIVVNNSFRNDTGATVSLVLNRTPTPAQTAGNVFSGTSVVEVSGPAMPFLVQPPRGLPAPQPQQLRPQE